MTKTKGMIVIFKMTRNKPKFLGEEVKVFEVGMHRSDIWIDIGPDINKIYGSVIGKHSRSTGPIGFFFFD